MTCPQTSPHLTTYMDVRSALASNDVKILESNLTRALINERLPTVLEAVKDFSITLKDPRLISDDFFDQLASFLITHKLIGQLYRVRRNMRGCPTDSRFIDFYRLCFFESRGHRRLKPVMTEDCRETPISIAMRLKTGGTATNQAVARALSATPPTFARDWIYRAASGEQISLLPTVVQHVQTLADLESLLHELSIAGPLFGKIHLVTSTLSSKISFILSSASFRAREIRESSFGEIIDQHIPIPEAVINNKIMRSDVEAFNSRFIFKTADGYLAFGTLGIGLGQYAIYYDGTRQILLSQDGVTPSTAHIPAFLRLDLTALDKLSKSDILLINPNFSRLGDCLDRFSFVNALVERAKVCPAHLININLLESVQDNFILPQTHNASDGGVKIQSIADLRSRRFERHYINSCHFRNNVDRRFSFSKGMVRALACKDKFDSPSMVLQNLRNNGYFVVHFAIEAEKRAFKNQWEVLSQIIVLLRKLGISKIVMLNSGLTSVANSARSAISEFETTWPEKIIELLPSEYRENAFVPIDLHLRSVDRKARAISMAHFFIGGLVTATVIPSSAEIPSLIIGSKTALSDEYRWPSGQDSFFIPQSFSTDVLSDQGKCVPSHLQGQYMSYEIDREALYLRLSEALSCAVQRWHKSS